MGDDQAHRKFPYDRATFSDGFARAFMSVVPDEKKYELSQDDVVGLPIVQLREKLVAFDKAVNNDFDWMKDVVDFIETSARFKTAVGWDEADDTYLTKMKTDFDTWRRNQRRSRSRSKSRAPSPPKKFTPAKKASRPKPAEPEKPDESAKDPKPRRSLDDTLDALTASMGSIKL